MFELQENKDYSAIEVTLSLLEHDEWDANKTKENPHAARSASAHVWHSANTVLCCQPIKKIGEV